MKTTMPFMLEPEILDFLAQTEERVATLIRITQKAIMDRMEQEIIVLLVALERMVLLLLVRVGEQWRGNHHPLAEEAGAGPLMEQTVKAPPKTIQSTTAAPVDKGRLVFFTDLRMKQGLAGAVLVDTAVAEEAAAVAAAHMGATSSYPGGKVDSEEPEGRAVKAGTGALLFDMSFQKISRHVS